MKSIVLIASLVLLGVSCKEETIQSFNNLTPGEQEAIRQANYNKCIGESQRNYEDFNATSNQQLVDMDRNQSWKYEYKRDDTVIIANDTISVWKVDGNTVYFRFKFTEGAATKNKFVKLTTAVNSEMILDLKEQKCRKRKAIVVSDSASSASAKTEQQTGNDDADTNYTINSTYSFDFNHPALFSSYRVTQVKKTYNNSTDALTKTENHVFTLTSISNPAAQNNDYTTYADREYCAVVPTTTGPNTYDVPFKIDCKTDSTHFNPAELAI